MCAEMDELCSCRVQRTHGDGLSLRAEVNRPSVRRSSVPMSGRAMDWCRMECAVDGVDASC